MPYAVRESRGIDVPVKVLGKYVPANRDKVGLTQMIELEYLGYVSHQVHHCHNDKHYEYLDDSYGG